MTRTPAALRIGAYMEQVARQDPAPAVRHQAQRALLDTLAVAVAGRETPAVRIARAHVASAEGRGTATAWTDGTALPPEEAAWLNGIASHVLDYDDVLAPMRGHVSVALIPAILALAPADPAAFARAYDAGFEVITRLSRAIVPEQYPRGWHSTSALGVIGAAVSGAVVLGLDATQTAHAIGLAVAQAAGSRQNFGTMAKSFQVGECGRAAVRSVLLARAGFDASPQALDGPAGYATLYGAGPDLAPVLEGLGEAPSELLRTGIEVKKYPCCYATHLGLDALLALRQQHGLTPDGVERIDITASRGAVAALIPGLPETGLEAKFSLHYTIAAALHDGSIGLGSFEGPRAMRPEVLAFMRRINVAEVDGPAAPRWTELALRLTGGREIRLRQDRLRGGADDPLTDAELAEKALDCLGFVGLGDRATVFAADLLRGQPAPAVLAALHSS